MELVREAGWNRVVIERDAQVVVKALQGNLHRGFQTQVVVDNVIAAASIVDNILFQFYFREANLVVHRLAKWVVSCFCSNIWRDGGPLWISDIVFSDFS